MEASQTCDTPRLEFRPRAAATLDGSTIAQVAEVVINDEQGFPPLRGLVIVRYVDGSFPLTKHPFVAFPDELWVVP